MFIIVFITFPKNMSVTLMQILILVKIFFHLFKYLYFASRLIQRGQVSGATPAAEQEVIHSDDFAAMVIKASLHANIGSVMINAP